MYFRVEFSYYLTTGTGYNKFIKAIAIELLIITNGSLVISASIVNIVVYFMTFISTDKPIAFISLSIAYFHAPDESYFVYTTPERSQGTSTPSAHNALTCCHIASNSADAIYLFLFTNLQYLLFLHDRYGIEDIGYILTYSTFAHAKQMVLIPISFARCTKGFCKYDAPMIAIFSPPNIGFSMIFCIFSIYNF